MTHVYPVFELFRRTKLSWNTDGFVITYVLFLEPGEQNHRELLVQLLDDQGENNTKRSIKLLPEQETKHKCMPYSQNDSIYASICAGVKYFYGSLEQF